MNYFESGLCFFCHNYINEVTRLKRFNDTIEAVWSERANELELKLKSSIEQSPECQHQDIGENFNSVYIETIIKYEFLHRQSTIITASSLVESALYKLCELISSASGQKFDLDKDKTRKSKIEKCIDHLSTVENFNMNALIEESKSIGILYKVRNEIVHNNGVFTKKIQQLNIANLKGSIGSVIEVSSEFIELYLQIITVFFEKLKHQVSVFMNRNAIQVN